MPTALIIDAAPQHGILTSSAEAMTSQPRHPTTSGMPSNAAWVHRLHDEGSGGFFHFNARLGPQGTQP
jgi:hypothetical protein